MSNFSKHTLGSPIVGIAKMPTHGSDIYDFSKVSVLLCELLRQGHDVDSTNSSVADNPLAKFVKPGDRVTVKPNLVLHKNNSGAGLESLVTNVAVIKATVDLVIKAGAGQIIVGDAPIQGCNLGELMDLGGYRDLAKYYDKLGVKVEWRDFRRSVLENADGIWDRHTGVRPFEDYVLFDLGAESLLEPISKDAEKFRVTMYNPELMKQTHSPGRHQYLVAREVIDADVVINLPKLKTHKKSGVTGALKNLVGINGNKDYLPHHRLGGSRTGGDCYEGGNPFKLLAEHFLDAGNKREGLIAYLLRQASRTSFRIARALGSDQNLEGSWHGNDTIWRTCLDLNRILIYGRPDGTLSDTPQRRILSITDALVCGEGDGPLSPTPHYLGILTLATNSAAAEYVHAHLMGFDWQKISIIREAFGRFPHPICDFSPEEIQVQLDDKLLSQPWPIWNERPFLPPSGWEGYCEVQNGNKTL
jgi:uncharacterized protein (DUF362 family)